jgi:hypothetical protein
MVGASVNRTRIPGCAVDGDGDKIFVRMTRFSKRCDARTAGLLGTVGDCYDRHDGTLAARSVDFMTPVAL